MNVEFYGSSSVFCPFLISAGMIIKIIDDNDGCQTVAMVLIIESIRISIVNQHCKTETPAKK